MLAYLTRRVAFLLFVVIGVTLLVFSIGNVVPADPARAAAGLNATEAQVEALRKLMRLDDPLYVQYGRYLWGLVHLDFGRSVRNLRPISEELARFLPATAELVLAAMVLYIVVGVPLGVVSAVKEGTILDRSTRFLGLAGIAMPEFWMALVFQFLFFGKLKILPSIGRLPMGMQPPQHITGLYTVDSLLTANWTTLGAALEHLALPAICLAVGRVAVLIRITRRSMINLLQEDFVRTARAKGLGEFAVVGRHAFRNAIMPVITIIGLQAGWLLNTTLVVETVFSWPGIGRYATESIALWDFLPVMGVTLVVAVSFVFINLLVDLVYAFADPRIRFG